ncbi:MAG: VOC family protein [Pseudomonadota bacterium]
MSDAPKIIPYLSYVDAKAAMAFLADAFGFETVIAADGEDGRLLHGEMRLGPGMVLIGTVDAGVPRQSPGIYAVIDDVDAHFGRAFAAGAEVVFPPEATEWGTRRYRVRDPEGHEWTFGSYQPQTEPPAWG